jgi:hypothetical protein
VRFVCRSDAGNISAAASASAGGGNASVVGYLAANPAARHVQAQPGTECYQRIENL